MWSLNNVAFISGMKYTVGNDLYFSKVNEGILHIFLQDSRRFDYCESLKKASERMIPVFDEIYKDLMDNISVIIYTDNNCRKDFIHILEGCIGICRMVSKSTGKANECVRILSLSDSSVKPRSGLSDGSISDKSQIWERYDSLRSDDKLRLAKKLYPAAEYTKAI